MLFFLYVGAVFAVIAAWLAILLTGCYPRGIFDFVAGVIGWHNRVIGYAVILVTDEDPPFRLTPPGLGTSHRSRGATASRLACLGSEGDRTPDGPAGRNASEAGRYSWPIDE